MYFLSDFQNFKTTNNYFDFNKSILFLESTLIDVPYMFINFQNNSELFEQLSIVSPGRRKNGFLGVSEKKYEKSIF